MVGPDLDRPVRPRGPSAGWCWLPGHGASGRAASARRPSICRSPATTTTCAACAPRPSAARRSAVHVVCHSYAGLPVCAGGHRRRHLTVRRRPSAAARRVAGGPPRSGASRVPAPACDRAATASRRLSTDARSSSSIDEPAAARRLRDEPVAADAERRAGGAGGRPGVAVGAELVRRLRRRPCRASRRPSASGPRSSGRGRARHRPLAVLQRPAGRSLAEFIAAQHGVGWRHELHRRGPPGRLRADERSGTGRRARLAHSSGDLRLRWPAAAAGAGA